MGRIIDMTDRRFGRLVAKNIAEFVKGKQRAWRCLCDCGNVVTVNGTSLRCGHTKSCGCLARELSSVALMVHGECAGGVESPEHRIYRDARRRCGSSTTNKYRHYYFERGIEFRFTSFDEFLDEVGRRPTPDHSLDRIDNDGHYEKGNVRWATRTEQQNNKTTNHLLTWQGQTKTAAEWAREIGMKPDTLRQRLYRGMSVEKALAGV